MYIGNADLLTCDGHILCVHAIRGIAFLILQTSVGGEIELEVI